MRYGSCCLRVDDQKEKEEEETYILVKCFPRSV